MNIKIEIPDEEIREAVKDAVVRDIVRKAARDVTNAAFNEYDGNMTHHLYSEIRKATREILREHIDEITAVAVDAAATTIANKGLKKLLEKAADG